MNMQQSSANIKKTQRVPNINTRKKLNPIEGRLPTEQNPEDSINLGVKKEQKRRIKKGYEIATYGKACQYLKTQSYMKKVTVDGIDTFERFGVCDQNSNLKEFGLGIYLYLEFSKRLLIALFIMSILSAFAMGINWWGTGLSKYPASYSHTLAKFTLGNLSNAGQSDYLVVTITDILSVVTLFIFYLHWRSFHNSTVEEMEKDHTILNPVLYALSVKGFDPKTPDLQQNLKRYIDEIYRGSYEIQIVYNYNRNFTIFIQYDQLIEKLQKERQVIYQTGKDDTQLKQIENQILEKQKVVLSLSDDFQPIYAIIHFRNLKSKYSFVNFCKQHGLVNSFSSKLKRTFCCLPLPDQRYYFNGNQILIQSMNLSRPEEINCQNRDISKCSRIIRWIFSIFFLVICVFITSSVIGLCTLYVSSSSSCSSIDASSYTTATAQAAGGQTLFCYCSQYYSFSGGNSVDLQTACSGLSRTIIITNLVQVSASVASSVTNTILIIIINLIATYLLRPQTKPKQFSFIFISVLVSNYLNSTILPLFLNGDIFTFQPVSYLKFVNFINTATVSIYSDFTADWYAVVSPYYTNFFIILCFMPFINLIVFWIKDSLNHYWVKKSCEKNQNDKNTHPTIQKEANQSIAWVVLDFPYEQAYLCLGLFMCMMYSSLIPLLVPLFTISIFINYLVKKFIIMRFSLRIPANQNLSQKTMNLIPIILLAHSCFGVWAHTSTGVFNSSAYVVKYSSPSSTAQVGRVFIDLLMLGTTAVIAVWIIFDYTILALFSFLGECCCKNELDLPVRYAAIENTNYEDRLRKANIHGSYKVSKHPIYGHAINQYKQLLHKTKLNLQEQQNTKQNILT